MSTLRFWGTLVGLALTNCGGAEFTAGGGTGGSSAAASAGSSSAGAAGASSGGAATGGSSGAPESAGSSSAGVAVTAGANSSAAGAPSIACDRSAWQVTAFASYLAAPIGGPPEDALDGNTKTRWTSGVNQADEQWFAIQLGEGQILEALDLDDTEFAGDIPPTVALELDGALVPSTYMQNGMGQAELVPTTPRHAKQARLILKTATVSWWSIGEISGRCSG